MRSPPPLKRCIVRPTATAGAVTVGALGGLLLLALPVAAQQPPDRFPTTGFSLWIDAVAAGIVTLLVCGGFVALAPGYTERTTDRILDRPGETFLYGLGIFVAAVVVVVLLAITIVGIVLAIPLAIALAVIGQLGYLAAGRGLADEWGVVLLIAVLVSAFSSGVPFLGGLVGFVLACMGTGAWYLDYRDGGAGSNGTDYDPSYSGGDGDSTGGDVTDQWGAESRAATSGDGHATGSDSDADTGATESDGDWGVAESDSEDDHDAVDEDDEWTTGFDDEDHE